MSRDHARRTGKAPDERSALYRRWLLDAALATAETEGLTGITVSRLLRSAHLTRKVFYDLFADVEDCLHAALAEVLERAGETIAAASSSKPGWREGTRAGLQTLLALVDQRPELARVCVIETLAGGPRLLALRGRVLREAREAIERGAHEPRARNPSPLIAEALIGGIAELLHARLLARERTPFSELAAPCMSFIVAPYLGPAAAAAELARRHPAPQSIADWAPPPQRPALQTPRLTYRTVRVLSAIAGHPGSSNREIAERAGIADEAQASKLLKRLATSELIENTSAHNSGNAWWLTERGRAFYAGIAPV